MRHLPALIALLLPLGLCTAATAEAQDTCTPIKFAAGTTGADVEGVAPPEGLVCFTLETGNGQTATIDVTRGQNIFFTIRDVVEVQDSHTFTTEARTYEIVVGQLMRSVTDDPFTLRISVTGP